MKPGRDFRIPLCADSVSCIFQLETTRWTKSQMGEAERVLEETGLSKKPSKTMKNTSTSIITDNTYIRQYKSGYYYILKKINGKRHHFGYYNDLDTVRFVRDELIEHDWDIGYHDFLREKYNGMKR